jgi:hypothetical protein
MYSRILNHVREELLPDIADAMRNNEDNMSVAEKMRLWGIDTAIQPGDDQDHCQDYEDEDDDDPHSTILAGYTDLRAFLLESEGYHWLLRQLELMRDYGHEGNSWLRVHRQVIKSLPARHHLPGGSFSMSLCLPWQPREFMHEQYGDWGLTALLDDVITISGSTDNAFASTCEAYVLRTWPEHGPFVLGSIERAVHSTEQTSQDFANNLALRITFYGEYTTFNVSSDPMFLAETAEIMVWLSVACRASAARDEIAIGHIDLQQVNDYRNDISFSGELALKDATISSDEGMLRATCWHGMFRNPVIAHGYPIPSRSSQEQGLELSIDLMLTLAQAFYGVAYCGVLMLKGFGTLLTPTRKENDAVTWHFIFDKTGARQSYNDGLQHSRLRNLDDAIFDGARHFVGWSRSAEFLTGEYASPMVRSNTSADAAEWYSNCQDICPIPHVPTQDSDTSSTHDVTESDTFCNGSLLRLPALEVLPWGIEATPIYLAAETVLRNLLTHVTGSPSADYDNIGFSGSKQTNSGLSAEAAFTLTAGKFVGVNAKFQRGSKDRPEWLKTENYIKNVEEAARFKVILSDSVTKQHWLADGCSVMLHLFRAWLSGKHTRSAPEGIASKIRSTNAVAGPQRSYETLTSGANRELQLYIGKHTHKESVSAEGSQSTSEKSTAQHAYFLLEDQAQYYYHWLEQIRDRMVLAKHSQEIGLIRQGNNVIGFEFVDLLRESSVEPCTMELGNGARAWHDYAKDWDAIHIIGAGFGELLRPVPERGVSQSTCGRDLTAPRDRDYLMAPLCVLKEGIDRFRHTRDCAQLSRGLYWSDTERCFGNCQCRNSRPLRKCQPHINNLSSTFTKKPQHNPSMRLPDVFHDRASGAIIIGTHLVARLLSTAGQKRALPVDNTLGHHSERSSPRRLPSDSGYVTNTDSNASQERRVADPTAGTPMPARGFQILGAANGNTLQKRRR